MAKVTTTAKIADTPEQKLAKAFREKFFKLTDDIDKLVSSHKKALAQVDSRLDHINNFINKIINPSDK